MLIDNSLTIPNLLTNYCQFNYSLYADHSWMARPDAVFSIISLTSRGGAGHRRPATPQVGLLQLWEMTF